MDEAQIVERMALVADDEATEVAEPGEEAFDFPPAPIAPKRTAILGLWDACGCGDGARSSRCPTWQALRQVDRHRRPDRR